MEFVNLKNYFLEKLKEKQKYTLKDLLNKDIYFFDLSWLIKFHSNINNENAVKIIIPDEFWFEKTTVLNNIELNKDKIDEIVKNLKGPIILKDEFLKLLENYSLLKKMYLHFKEELEKKKIIEINNEIHSTKQLVNRIEKIYNLKTRRLLEILMILYWLVLESIEKDITNLINNIPINQNLPDINLDKQIIKKIIDISINKINIFYNHPLFIYFIELIQPVIKKDLKNMIYKYYQIDDKIEDIEYINLKDFYNYFIQINNFINYFILNNFIQIITNSKIKIFNKLQRIEVLEDYEKQLIIVLTQFFLKRKYKDFTITWIDEALFRFFLLNFIWPSI